MRLSLNNNATAILHIKLLPCTCHWEEFFSAEVFRVKSVEEIFEADQRFSIHHASCNGSYFIALHALQLYNEQDDTLECDNSHLTKK